jgi:hypothetical protein
MPNEASLVPLLLLLVFTTMAEKDSKGRMAIVESGEP